MMTLFIDFGKTQCVSLKEWAEKSWTLPLCSASVDQCHVYQVNVTPEHYSHFFSDKILNDRAVARGAQTYSPASTLLQFCGCIFTRKGKGQAWQFEHKPTRTVQTQGKCFHISLSPWTHKVTGSHVGPTVHLSKKSFIFQCTFTSNRISYDGTYMSRNPLELASMKFTIPLRWGIKQNKLYSFGVSSHSSV